MKVGEQPIPDVGRLPGVRTMYCIQMPPSSVPLSDAGRAHIRLLLEVECNPSIMSLLPLPPNTPKISLNTPSYKEKIFLSPAGEEERSGSIHHNREALQWKHPSQQQSLAVVAREGGRTTKMKHILHGGKCNGLRVWVGGGGLL